MPLPQQGQGATGVRVHAAFGLDHLFVRARDVTMFSETPKPSAISGIVRSECSYCWRIAASRSTGRSYGFLPEFGRQPPCAITVPPR